MCPYLEKKCEKISTGKKSNFKVCTPDVLCTPDVVCTPNVVCFPDVVCYRDVVCFPNYDAPPLTTAGEARGQDRPTDPKSCSDFLANLQI